MGSERKETDRILEKARNTAEHAAREAGELAKRYFELEFEVEEKGDHGDVVTTVDHKAEALILLRIRSAFPDHQIRSEETGWSGVEGQWLWLVDPLDGTNNYAIGLPVYGVSITLLQQKEPVLGVIYDSHLGHLYSAERGKGAVRKARPHMQLNEPGTDARLLMNDGDRSVESLHVRGTNAREANVAAVKPLHRMTVGWIQGHHVQKDPSAMKLKQELDARFKRVVRLWAPALLWCMLARGDLDAIVLYNSEGDDLYAGVLLAKEAGASVVDFTGKDFVTMNSEPYLIASRPEYVEPLLALVKETIGE